MGLPKARVFAPEESLASLYRILWAAPGFPEFLLQTPLCTMTAQERQKRVLASLNDEEEEDDDDEDMDAMMMWGGDDDTDMAAYQFAFFHFNFLVRSVTKEGVYGNLMSEVNAGRAPLRRELPCFSVAARRLGELYVESSAACGDALCAGPGALTVLLAGEPALRRELLGIGLGPVVLEEVESAASKSSALDLLLSIPEADWQAMPVAASAKLAGDLANRLNETNRFSVRDVPRMAKDFPQMDVSEFEDAEEEPKETAYRKILNVLFRRNTLDGLAPTKNAKEIMEAVLELKGMRKMGHADCEVEARAFFHFVLGGGAGCGGGPGVELIDRHLL